MKFYDETQQLYLETDVSVVDSDLPYYKPEAVQPTQEPNTRQLHTQTYHIC